MKKAIAFITVLILLLSSFSGTVHAQINSTTKPPKLQVLGTEITKDLPVINDNIIYLPFRTITQKLGYKVAWYSKTNTMEVTKENHSAKITIGSKNAYVNSKKITLDSAPILNKGRAYVPYDFIEKHFDYNIAFDKNSNIVTISDKVQSSKLSSDEEANAIYIMDKKLEGSVPFFSDDKVYVPARTVSEALGYKVYWYSAKKRMDFVKDKKKISMTVDNKTVTSGIKKIKLEEAVIMHNEKVYMPVSVLEKVMSYFTASDAGKATVWISDKKIVKTNPSNNTGENKGQNNYATANVTDISVDISMGFPVIKIMADNAFDYTSFALSGPERFVIDIQNAVVKTSFDSKEVKCGAITQVRIGQFSLTPSKVVRLVVDMESSRACKIVQSEDKKTLTLIYANLIKPVAIGKEGNQDVITITGTDAFKTVATKLENPDRLVFDIAGGVHDGEDQIINTESTLLKSVRTGQFDSGTARVVLDVNPNVFYYVESLGNITKIYLSDIPYDFFVYRKYYNSAYIDINPGLQVEYQASIDKENSILKIVIPQNLEVVSRRYEINDNVMEYIEVKEQTVRKKPQTIVIFKMKQLVNYELLSPAITELVKLKFKYTATRFEDLTIIIDAGHGGRDPGAVASDGTMEKDLTLDVAKRLNSKLQAIGFKTIMTRSDDTYVDLATRADTANNSYADFFMSIHFNAFNSKTKGIETLYFPNTVTDENPVENKKIADIFHSEVTTALNMPSRGITARPNLYVLNKTKMPAILSELGFMTNPGELEKIKTEEYREMAAKALAVSIIKYFKDIQKLDFNFDTQVIYDDSLVNTVTSEKVVQKK